MTSVTLYEAMAHSIFEVAISKHTVNQSREKVKCYRISSWNQQFSIRRGRRGLLNASSGQLQALLLESVMPKGMRYEVVNTATYLINRSPTVSIEGHVTTAELGLRKKPDILKVGVLLDTKSKTQKAESKDPTGSYGGLSMQSLLLVRYECG